MHRSVVEAVVVALSRGISRLTFSFPSGDGMGVPLGKEVGSAGFQVAVGGGAIGGGFHRGSDEVSSSGNEW